MNIAKAMAISCSQVTSHLHISSLSKHDLHLAAFRSPSDDLYKYYSHFASGMQFCVFYLPFAGLGDEEVEFKNLACKNLVRFTPMSKYQSDICQ